MGGACLVARRRHRSPGRLAGAGEQFVERVVAKATLDELGLGEDAVVVGVHLGENVARALYGRVAHFRQILVGDQVDRLPTA